MQTRIREFRKLRGMTLKELADKIKTTPQTVQRLETDNMTVSTCWLEKIARVLLVEPRDLIGGGINREIRVIGNVGKSGRINPVRPDQDPVIHLEVPADNPIAVRLDLSVGSYIAGQVLIANKFRDEDIDSVHGINCIVQINDGPIFLCRVIRGRDHGWILVPLDNGGEVQYDREIDWAARILMSVKYY